jgi:hypothetical protein
MFAFGVITPVEADQQSGGEYIAVDGSSVTIRLWEAPGENGQWARFYEVSDNGRVLRRTEASYEIGLRYAHFDPLESVPDVEPMLMADDDVNLFIVQFFTQPLEVYGEKIAALGGTVRHYIAQFAYLVEMDGATRQSVENLPYVRWVGAYQPAYRLEEFMLDNLYDAGSAYPLQRYNIQVTAVDKKSMVAERLAALGARVDNADAGKVLVEATLTPDQLFNLVRWDEVLFVDRWGPYEEDMNIVREIGGADYIETVAGFDGTDVRGEVFDNGFNLNHVDLQSPPLIQHGAVGSSSHGSATSGICFGDGTGEPNARGLLPAAQGIVADYGTIGLTGTSRYNHSGELVNPPYEAVFQTASVGSPRTTEYTTISADADAYCFDFDLVHLQSQSNAGDQMSRPQAWAKNMISGGGIRHYNTLDRSDDMWSYGASIGPASDGRVKPTFTHFYDYVWTTYWPNPTSYTTSFSGTSAATPIIAGHVGLFFQMWDEGIFGNPVDPNASVFENRAHMSTAKAMLIATAYQYDFSGPYHDKTRTHQGWGMPDLQKMYDMRNQIYVIDETDVLLPFETAYHTVTVNPLEPELKITLVYSDPPGNPAVQTQHRINDLTLKVTSPSSVVYWGNNGLYDGPYSLPGGSPDDKNTVENVFIQNPEAGDWTIEISADEIIQDSHLETTVLDADYALVVSGVAPGVQPSFTVQLTYQSGSPVPPSGGDLTFDVYVENTGTSSANFDGWLDIEYEAGPPTTVVQRAFTNFQPGG